MRHRCTIQRQVSVGDGGGGFTESWTTWQTNVPCRMWFVSGFESMLGEQEHRGAENMVIVPLNVDVKASDRISQVVNRKGTVLLDGFYGINYVGRRLDHQQLGLTARSL
jgi:head-tail adaptor